MHGVAHGNISPACVLVEAGAPTSRGLVADVRRTAEMIQYHSPERFRNGQLSPLDDAWALAGTLFTMLTTARPFGELRPEIEARIYQGVPPLGAYGINDDQLYAIVAAALSPDPTRRTQSVTTFRLHLEHWANDPSIRELAALEDEEGGEDDQAATAMVAMEAMVFEEPSTSTSRSASIADSSNLFAPPSFDPRSSDPRMPPSRPSRPEAMPVQASPLGEQDATVMRELPAHIIAMAARAASGSSPPPPMEEAQPTPAPTYGQPQQGFPQPQPGFAAPPQAEEEPDYGQATKIAPAPDMAAVLLQSREPVAGPPPVPQRPPPMGTQRGMAPGQLQAPGGPPSPRQIPRAFKQTQLGMGGVGAPPAIPRPGFNAPPSQPFQYPQEAPPPEPPPAPDAADDDDGGRTVMRESPAISPEMFQNAAQGQWKPAPPPVQPRAFGGGTDRPPGQADAIGAPLSLGPEPGGVSALIQETLQQAPGQPQPMSPLGQPNQPLGPPPGFPQGNFEPTAGFPGPFQPTSGGPFQPVGMQQQQQGYPGQQPFDLGPPLGNFGQGGSMLDQPSMDMQPPMPLDPGGYPRAPSPPAKSRGSGAGLVVVCLLVLVLAAALTFLALKFRPQLGF